MPNNKNSSIKRQYFLCVALSQEAKEYRSDGKPESGTQQENGQPSFALELLVGFVVHLITRQVSRSY